MNYEETCDYLFNKTANFESQGQQGYKPGLETMEKLDEHFGHPHQKFKSIHIAGTNGKGSVSHMLAAQLQVCGYKVGLYTSPHIMDYAERIRVNGHPIAHDYVVNFVEQEKNFIEQLEPTFFEITTALAFKYFAENDVDIAVIETGLGGRLDSTTIITPLLSIITTVAYDHTDLLGGTLEQIAVEKGGIIKKNVPVIIGDDKKETRTVFEALANDVSAPITFVMDESDIVSHQPLPEGGIEYTTKHQTHFVCELSGDYQVRNVDTTLHAILALMKMGYLCDCTIESNIPLINQEMNDAFMNVCKITGLQGRWQVISTQPKVVCDTGHNPEAWTYLSKQLEAQDCQQLHIVFGMVDDKDIYTVMSMLPQKATYYFTKASTKRAMSEQSIMLFGQQFGLQGSAYPTVEEAYKAAREAAADSDFIFIGGSSYVVADFLKTCN